MHYYSICFRYDMINNYDPYYHSKMKFWEYEKYEFENIINKIYGVTILKHPVDDLILTFKSNNPIDLKYDLGEAEKRYWEYERKIKDDRVNDHIKLVNSFFKVPMAVMYSILFIFTMYTIFSLFSPLFHL